MERGLDFSNLTVDCLSAILSLTSPPDACRSSSVSSLFRSAADSDVVWDRFLPSDYRNIVKRSVTPLNYSSKKELFFRLCNPILLDGGNKSFVLEKSGGRKAYILSARELSISFSNEPNHWTWKSLPESRFSEVAELKSVGRLKIQGKIKTMLSPNTRYGAYLIMKISDGAYGLDSIPSEIRVQSGDRAVTNTAYLRHPDGRKQQMESLFYGNRMELLRKRVIEGEGRVPHGRADGWMEIELGEFFIGGDEEAEKEAKMSLMEVKGPQLKGGLIIEGIEVRPKD